MKKYYIVRGNFSNTYSLYWVRRGETVPNGEEITRAEAMRLCRAERKRRKTNPYFAGYADAYIMPYGCEEAENPAYILKHLDSTSFVVL